MADVEKKEIEQPQETFLKIRMTLTSTKVKELEQVCSSIIDNAVNNQLVKKGPVRLPTKVLKITTRKTPNGEGSKTWETYEMRIHKRYIDVVSPASLVKKITQLTVQPGVEIEVTIVA
ncbi:40S ribosomal protein S20 [Hanseniaspora vineae]|uniref:Small ribosomal subunit protein uS10 n=1 Tax=Hanseniaspora osmophila TaxID=56408 RepID=A0A1E5RGT5_9ASCO|nr:40S ribosomal protein S20 [Hanseniaspora osmophila]